ncbi:unnamed protein product [Lactuca saligna]|uniref:Uncharacterized protein n=1 Tax=Lactuca saligna TaxID=75948 RepID=A0AA36EIV3_LACSI|nr:unnamed protein product [Lactuca saligna]
MGMGMVGAGSSWMSSGAILVHGFQLVDIWVHHSTGNTTNSKISKLLDMSAAGSLWDWKSVILRNVGFFSDIMTLLMALGHYVQIWRLHGMRFHLVNAMLFLNIRFVAGCSSFLRGQQDRCMSHCTLAVFDFFSYSLEQEMSYFDLNYDAGSWRKGSQELSEQGFIILN